ncbi:MAG TPA: hypothetical protein VHO27_06965, partial [Angustibacter sp.]|nr:hypothetical protein [Angustibacter sp.]
MSEQGRVIPLDRGRSARSARGADAVAAGARRASGERARRRRTPLLPEPAPEASTERDAALAAGEAAAVADLTAEAAEATADAGQPGDASAEQLAADDEGGGLDPAALVRYAVEAVVEALVAEGQRAGLADVDRHVASALAFLRRRLAGEYVVDEFGFDADLTEALLPALRPLYRSWFRVEVRGIENIPADGGALVVANHSGTIALDSLMTQLA